MHTTMQRERRRQGGRGKENKGESWLVDLIYELHGSMSMFTAVLIKIQPQHHLKRNRNKRGGDEINGFIFIRFHVKVDRLYCNIYPQPFAGN